MQPARWAATLLLSCASAAAAQQPPAPRAGTPAECVAHALEWRNRETQQRVRTGQPVNLEPLILESQRRARACGAAFTLENVAPAQLPGLAELYQFTGDAGRAELALARALARPDLPLRTRGELLLRQLNASLPAGTLFTGLAAEAESLMVQLDALPDSLAELRLRGHQLLANRYGYADVTEGIRRHAGALVELGRRSGIEWGMRFGYADLARVAADLLDPDSALRILDRAEAELGVPRDSIRDFADARRLYSLAGTTAPPIHGDVWLNADGARTLTPGDGRVYLVQFTAHWCGPCRNSYEGMKRLAARFRAAPVSVLFVTGLYGRFEGRPVTREQELAADRTYYLERYGIPFPIAISEQSRGETERAYRVRAVPQIVVIDRQGSIRQIVIGWDAGHEARLGRYIDSLLKATEH